MHALRWLLLACGLLVLGPAAAYEPHSGPALPPGSTLTLERPIRISSYDNRVLIQHGRVISDAQRDRYTAFCSIGLRRGFRADGPARIEPDTFEVIEYESWRGVGRDELDGLKLAELGGGAGVGAPGMLRYHTRVVLRSENQPQVDDMECIYNARPHNTALAFEDIRDTLAGLATIERAEP